MPELSRDRVEYFYSDTNTPIQSSVMNAVDFFDVYPIPSGFESTVDPLSDLSCNMCRTVAVDEVPLDSSPGVLQLKLPTLCSDDADADMYSTPPLFIANRISNINFSTLFTTTLTSVYDLALSHITFAVDSISVEQMIRRIRNVRLNTPEIHEIFQTDNSSSGSLYAEHLICICFDSYGNHRFAKFIVNVKEVSMESGPLDKWSTFDAVALEVIHLQGDSRISMEYFKRARFCVSIGDDILDSDYAIDMPDFREGFSDMYEDNMVCNPNSFE